MIHFDTPKQIKALEKELYKPISKVRLSDILPNRDFPAGQEYAIADLQGNIINFCSAVYFPKLNSEIFPLVEPGLTDAGFDFKKKIKIVDGAKFYVDYVIMERMKTLSVNDVFPKLCISNSYDGSTKFRKEFGFYKLLCSNGLSRPTENISSVSFKHTKNNECKIDDIVKITKSFIIDSRNDMQVFEKMNRVKSDVKSLISIAGKLSVAKHVIQAASERFLFETKENIQYLNEHNEEVTSKGTPETMFAVYNALNWAIYNTNPKELPEKKLEKDRKILEAIESFI